MRLIRWLRFLPLAKPFRGGRDEDEENRPLVLHNDVWYTASAQKHYSWHHADAALRTTWLKPREEPSKRTKGEKAYMMVGLSDIGLLEVKYEYATDGRRVVFHVNRKSGQGRLARVYRHERRERKRRW